MIPAGAHLVLNLVLAGPDHKEEVGAKHPPGDHGDHGDGVGEAYCSQDDPRLHETDVSLKYKYIAISPAVCTRIIGFHVKEMLSSDSLHHKMQVNRYTVPVLVLLPVLCD